MKRIFAFLLGLVMIFTVFSPTNMKSAEAASKMSVEYFVHVQTFGDSQGWVRDGASAGTSGQSKRLESIKIRLAGNEYQGNVVYKTHVQTYGWQPWAANGEISGTQGLAKRLEGIEIYLTGEVAKHYDIMYRVHCQSYGWMPWVSNGEMAGTSGESKRLEAIQIKLVPKKSIVEMGVQYRTHCQTYGWLNWSMNGSENGTTGEGKRLEAIEIKLNGNRYSGGISYKTHVQSYGWEKDMLSNGAMSGTSGQSKRLEAIQIELYGEVADYYDVYYRVHAQSYGWLGWAKNGENAGTSKMSKRLEAIEIKLVEKDADKSQYENGNDSYVEGEDAPVPVDARAQAVVDLCNSSRRANGVNNMLSIDPVLTLAANIRAKEIYQSFSHTRPNGTSCFTVYNEVGYSYMAAGENIAAGYTSPESVMEGWINSPGHRANILNASFNKIGVACYEVPNSIYRYHWVQLFSD